MAKHAIEMFDENLGRYWESRAENLNLSVNIAVGMRQLGSLHRGAVRKNLWYGGDIREI